MIVVAIVGASVFFGARVAEPGEFTNRAFINEKIDSNQYSSLIKIYSPTQPRLWSDAGVRVRTLKPKIKQNKKSGKREKR